MLNSRLYAKPVQDTGTCQAWRNYVGIQPVGGLQYVCVYDTAYVTLLPRMVGKGLSYVRMTLI